MAVGFAGAAEPVGRSWSQMSIRITMGICIAEVDKTFLWLESVQTSVAFSNQNGFTMGEEKPIGEHWSGKTKGWTTTRREFGASAQPDDPHWEECHCEYGKVP